MVRVVAPSLVLSTRGMDRAAVERVYVVLVVGVQGGQSILVIVLVQD